MNKPTMTPGCAITLGEKYGYGIQHITDPQEAKAYFEECVQHMMGFGHTHDKAVEIEHSNFGYMAGYYDQETRLRIEELYGSIHPIFGSAKFEVTPEQAFNAGIQAAAAKSN